jgi:hypothetical protein
MSDGGKGSKPRPFSVSKDEYDDRYEAIFGKKRKEEQTMTMRMPGTLGSADIIFTEDIKDEK